LEEAAMATRSFDALYAQAMGLYDEQKYVEALDVLTREGGNFAERAADIAYLRSCMAVRAGKPELAVTILEEAVQQGYWYGEQVMRLTPSWQTLQGTPAFERVAAVCKEREAAEHPESRVFVREPEGGIQSGQRYPLLIALHGNGDTASQALAGWHAVTSGGWLLAAVQSSEMIGSNAYGWFDVDRAFREIQGQYASLCEQYPIDTGRVILAGFSMGGELALRLTLEGTIPARGFVLLGPGGTIETADAWLPFIEAGATRGLRGYVLLGAQDVNISLYDVRSVVTLLNEHGIPCGLEIIPGVGHTYPAENAPILERALAFVEQDE
jgi:predicted esterase